MKAKSRVAELEDLLRARLTDMIDMRHELVKLAALIDWECFEREWADFFSSGNPRAAARSMPCTSRRSTASPRGREGLWGLPVQRSSGALRSPNARARYKFGCKVSVTTMLDEGFVVGMRSFPGNPYDGHTLTPALEHVEILTGQRPDLAVFDRGYRGHDEDRTRVLISGTRRGLESKLRADLRRRSAIEAEIGRMKTDDRLARCPFKGVNGDAIFAVLYGCGHNIRNILAHLRAILALVIITILAIPSGQAPQQVGKVV